MRSSLHLYVLPAASASLAREAVRGLGGAIWVGSSQVGSSQVGSSQVGSSQMGSPRVGTMPGMRTSACSTDGVGRRSAKRPSNRSSVARPLFAGCPQLGLDPEVLAA